MNNSGLTTSVAGEGLGAGVGPAPGAGTALGAGRGAEKIGWPCKWKIIIQLIKRISPGIRLSFWIGINSHHLKGK